MVVIFVLEHLPALSNGPICKNRANTSYIYWKSSKHIGVGHGLRGLGMSRTKMRKTARDKLENMTPQERSKAVRSISCRETMTDANWVFANDTMADVLDDLTQNNWDHVFVVNKEGVPMGRIHAVDVLKIVAKKNVERSVAWMLSVPAKQLIHLPPLTVKSNTPLLKAGALMLTHDLNQVAVVNQQGVLVGVVGHNTMAKNLPRFIL